MDLNQTIEILQSGGTILYPTDTIWGLGCDATQSIAIKRIIELKGIDQSKNLSLQHNVTQSDELEYKTKPQNDLDFNF